MKEIRFAAIPKCASRSLDALGLLGELHDKRHSKITEYPEWQRYEWYYVERDPEEWYRSWWLESRLAGSPFAKALGMQFEDFESDMERFEFAHKIGRYAGESGVNEWVPREPDEFIARFIQFRKLGFGFKEYCQKTIMDGVPCKQVHISGLDSWLVARGYRPVHENVRQPLGGLTPAEFLHPHPDLLKLAKQLKESGQLSSFLSLIGDLAMPKERAYAAL